jgi:hypothetical protein
MEEERDIYALNLGFISKVVSGKPASLETFKEAWKELRFSFIFLVRVLSGYMFDIIFCVVNFEILFFRAVLLRDAMTLSCKDCMTRA